MLEKLKVKAPLVFMGPLIKGRINPISTIVSSKNYTITLHPVSDSTQQLSCKSIKLVEEFIGILSKEMGEEISLTTCIEDEIRFLPTITMYSMHTYAIALVLSREYDVNIIDVMESFMGIESELLGKELPQYIQALRLTIMHGKPLIYRYGEGEVVNEEPATLYAVVEKIDTESKLLNKQLYDDELVNMLTKVAGINTIKSFNAQRSKDYYLLSHYCRVENSIWHALYGYSIPSEAVDTICTKITLDINRPIVLKLYRKTLEDNIKGISVLI